MGSSSPTRSGRFRLCLDLVQVYGDEVRSLPVPPVERAIEVRGSGPGADASLRLLAHAYRERSGPSPDAVSRCEQLRRTGR